MKDIASINKQMELRKHDIVVKIPDDDMLKKHCP